jgi:hypothetical protein
MDFPWSQISGALAGGLVGGFAGFVSNSIQQHRQSVCSRRSVARALMGEVGAITKRIELEYLNKLSLELAALKSGRYPGHFFRGSRDLARVFCSMGEQLGCLPSELVSELVAWYINLAIYQDREFEVHEMTSRRSPEFMDYAIELVELQYTGYSDLVQLARPILTQLAAF